MTATKTTLPAFKAWAKDTVPIARALMLAQAFAAVERERVAKYVRPIFESFPFVYGPIAARCGLEGQRITTEKDLYLCEDTELLTAYYTACDAAHRAHGFRGPEGHCPALTAEYLVMEAERALIDAAAPLFGITDVYGDNRKKYLDLLLGACVKAADEHGIRLTLEGR